MKISISNIFAVLLLLIGLSGCMDSRLSDMCDQKGGAKVSVFFTPIKETTIMRSEDPNSYGARIENCVLFCFNDQGDLVSKWTFEYNPNLNPAEERQPDFTPQDRWQNSFGITNRRGKLYFYAIANLKKDRNDLGFFDEDPSHPQEPTYSDIAPITDKSKLDKILSISQSRLLDNDFSGRVLMVGYEEVDAASAPSGINVDVELKPLFAKLSFDISVSKPRDGHYRTFEPLEWRLINVPTKVQLFPNKDNDEKFEPQANYVDFAWQTFSSKSFINGTKEQSAVPNLFSCYVTQNRLPAQVSIDWTTFQQYMQPTPSVKNITERDFNSDPSYAFGMRAHRKKVDAPTPERKFNVDNGPFDVAPEHATAIQVRGVYTDDTGSKKRRAVVQYTIPMGYVNGKVNDYSVTAHHHYIYHAYVEDVDRIKLEVEDNNTGLGNHNESDANSEGQVYDALSVKEVDAHYCTLILTIKKSDVEKYGHDKIGFDYSVVTPFDNGGKEDITWVRFMLMPKEGNQYASTLPDNFENTVYNHIDNIGPNYVGWSASSRFPAYYADGLCKMLNAELGDKIVHGQESSLWDRNGEIRIAVLVQEYYYEVYPLNVHNAPVNNNVDNGIIQKFRDNGWQFFVNQPNRILNLYYHTPSNLLSADRQSLYSSADFAISQRSIKTLSKSGEKGSTSVGFETIDEEYEGEGPAPQFDYTNGYFAIQTKIQGQPNPNPYAPLDYFQDNQAQGYRPTLQLYEMVSERENRDIVQNVPWSKFRVAYKDHYRPHFRVASGDDNKDNRYSAMFYGCLSRNSDLNGNGTIDLDEIRWYIPAYRSLLQMILADNTLPISERLLNSNLAQTYPYFIMTTTGAKEHDLWCIDVSQFATVIPFKLKRRGSLRCIRNIGVSPHNFSLANPKNTGITAYEQKTADPISVTGFYETQPKQAGSSNDYYTNNSSTFPFLSNNVGNDSYSNIGMVIHLDQLDPKFLRHEYLSTGALRYNSNDASSANIGNDVTVNSTLNQPYYKGFRVAVNVLANGAVWGRQQFSYMSEWLSHTSEYSGALSTCLNYKEKNPDGTIETGWRLPNVAELAIMNSYIPWSKDQNRRGWGQWGLKHGGIGKRTWFAPTISVTRIPGNESHSFILYDTGQDGFITIGTIDSYHQLLNLDWINDGMPLVARCVKDWNPNYEKYGHKSASLQ